MTTSIESHFFITLAHFCDIHGPRVIQVTQVARGAESLEQLLLRDYPTDAYCESCQFQFPNVDKQREKQHIPHDVDIKLRSMESHINSVHYVSTQYSATRYLLLSSIIKKVFSEETMVYDESPLLFYDEERGFNVAVGFKLQDNFSRGNERRYCLIFSISDVNEVLSMNIVQRHLEFLLSSFGRMIQFVKTQRNQVLLQLQQDQQNPFMPTSSYLRSNTSKLPRSLSRLVEDEEFFVKLHKWNAYILTNIDLP
ncbi:hypothetical protein ACO0QE_003385 [Hanseniaspora vineae]